MVDFSLSSGLLKESFTDEVIEAVWEKGIIVPEVNPDQLDKILKSKKYYF